MVLVTVFEVIFKDKATAICGTIKYFFFQFDITSLTKSASIGGPWKFCWWRQGPLLKKLPQTSGFEKLLLHTFKMPGDLDPFPFPIGWPVDVCELYSVLYEYIRFLHFESSSSLYINLKIFLIICKYSDYFTTLSKFSLYIFSCNSKMLSDFL